MTATRIFIPLFFLIGFLFPAAAEDWPTYRGNAGRTGYTAEPIPNGLSLRWVFQSDHPPRPSWPNSDRIDFDLVFQPVIFGDLVLFGSSVDDQVRAIDATSGKVVWTFFTGAPVRFAPAVNKGRVFVASDDGWLYALSLQDGTLIWKFRGGPDNGKVIGNQRITSKWPARGGPVVAGDNVYFSAGIWPSDGIFLHALNIENGQPVWSNGETGRIFMRQPHGGAEANSGVSSQGYLVATDKQIIVPTGRSIPAAFDRAEGKLLHYRLADNQKRGGSRALIADRFLLNSGCLFDLDSGDLHSQVNLGPAVALAKGLVQAHGKSLAVLNWQDKQAYDRRGEAIKVRSLIQKKQTAMDREVLDFIVAGGDAICGQDGHVCAVDYNSQQTIWWSHEVEGQALGLAAANGRLVVSTDRGLVYCFDGEPAAPINKANTTHHAAEIDTSLAEKILKASAIRNGFCVDLGAGDGELAIALAQKSELQVYAVTGDPASAAAVRKRVSHAGLYGSRITVIEADPANSGLPPNFANLVVSSEWPHFEAEMKRIQRPYGGKICTVDSGKITLDNRGPLAGAGSWTHQNSSPANKLCSDDSVIRGPLSMFWFRDIDFEIPNRHGQGPAPLVHNGYMVVGGVDGIACLDAFNGRTMWIFQLEGNLSDYDGIHHDVAVGETGSNFCLSDDAVFVVNRDRCLRIDLATGKQTGEFLTPVADRDSPNRNWGYLAWHDGQLLGSVLDDSHRVSPRYQLTSLRTESVKLFAIDGETGQLNWEFEPKGSIRNNSIAVSGKRVFLIDRPLVSADGIPDPKRNRRSAEKITADQMPTGHLIALNASNGTEAWRNEEDIFGTQLAVSEQHSTLIMNYQAVRHKFFWLPSEIGGRIAGFNTETGKLIWSRKADYQTRPVINDYTIYAQGGAWNLLTGEPIPFDLNRSYGCGQISSSKHLMLFRSATLGYRDLTRDAGTENFGGIRPSCWINAIPANGLVLVPDGSSKCNCSYQMKAWFALQPGAGE